MNFETMSDGQIIQNIASFLEKKRLQKRIKAAELAEKGGFSAQTYSNFQNKKTDIRLSTLIQILRGLGELEKLERVFSQKEPVSLTGRKIITTQRVRTSSFAVVTKQNHLVPEFKIVERKDNAKEESAVDVDNEDKRIRLEAAERLLANKKKDGNVNE